MTANNDLRALLEAVAFSDDARLTPGDRLKAAELLAGLSPTPRAVPAEIAELPDSILDDELDLLALDAARAVLDNRPVLDVEPDQWPNFAAYLGREVERRVSAEVARLVDVGQRSREIDAAAEHKARQLYETRAFRAIHAQDAVSGPSGAGDRRTHADTPGAATGTQTAARRSLERLRSFDADDEPTHRLR